MVTAIVLLELGNFFCLQCKITKDIVKHLKWDVAGERYGIAPESEWIWKYFHRENGGGGKSHREKDVN